EFAQVVVFVGLAGAGGDGVAELREHAHGGAANAAGRAGDDDGAALGADAVLFERDDRLRRGEAGGADSHRLLRGQAFGEANDPVRGDAGEFGVATRVRNTEVVADDDDG